MSQAKEAKLGSVSTHSVCPEQTLKPISKPTMPFFPLLPLFRRNCFSVSGRDTELISIYAVWTIRRLEPGTKARAKLFATRTHSVQNSERGQGSTGPLDIKNSICSRKWKQSRVACSVFVSFSLYGCAGTLGCRRACPAGKGRDVTGLRNHEPRAQSCMLKQLTGFALNTHIHALQAYNSSAYRFLY